MRLECGDKPTFRPERRLSGDRLFVHRPQWPQSPASGFQVLGCPGAETGVCGAYRGAMRIISRERKVPPQGIRDRR